MIDKTALILFQNETILSTRTKEKEVCFRCDCKREKEKMRSGLFRFLCSQTH
ncbi:MAG: hypothetical protein ACJAU2_001447 [Maribacter sp.]|jgi:hypothetical protein